MQGVIITTRNKEKLEKHLLAIWQHTPDVQVAHQFDENWFTYYTLTAKSMSSDDIDCITRLFERPLFGPYPPEDTIERLCLCRESGCFLPVAAHRAKDRLGDVWIMDQYGVSDHRIHDQCWHHVAPVYHTMVNTAEVFDPEPEYKGECWTKIVSWKGRVSWYAQMVSVVDEGGYEAPESQRYAYYASPYYIGRGSRQEAISKAELHEF
jgi:hypothetical protein